MGITLYTISSLYSSALLNQVEAIPVSSLLLELAALAIIHDCFFGGSSRCYRLIETV
jgi:hypothetical protein